MTKAEEIDLFKSNIEKVLNIKIMGTWLPNIGEFLDKECLFFILEEAYNNDYLKITELELKMNEVSISLLKDSKFFNCIAIL